MNIYEEVKKEYSRLVKEKDEAYKNKKAEEHKEFIEAVKKADYLMDGRRKGNANQRMREDLKAMADLRTKEGDGRRRSVSNSSGTVFIFK